MAFLDTRFARGDGVDCAAPVQFTGNNRIIPGAVINIDYAGHNSFSHIRAQEDAASLVKDFNDIAGLDAFFSGICGIDPHGLIGVSVRPDDFTGLDFS